MIQRWSLLALRLAPRVVPELRASAIPGPSATHDPARGADTRGSTRPRALLRAAGNGAAPRDPLAPRTATGAAYAASAGEGQGDEQPHNPRPSSEAIPPPLAARSA
jgi:hypothetical protein